MEKRIYSTHFQMQDIISLITESQNGWGWKGPLEVIWSNTPAQAGPPRSACLGPSPGHFWISPRMQTQLPLWATCACAHSPSQCFPMFRGNLLCFSLCPLPLVLLLGATEKSLVPSSLHPLFRYLHTLIRCPLSLFLSWLNSLSQLSHHRRDFPVRYPSLWPLVGLPPLLDVSCTGKPRIAHTDTTETWTRLTIK